MSEFFFEYGLFTAKVITVVGAILIALLIFAIALVTREREKEAIEIEKINDKLDDIRDVLESELLTKEELKILKKERRKQEKEKAKLNKKHAKQGHPEPSRPRIFVLRFNGDLHASDVNPLRESITAVLTVAKPEDEVFVILESAGGLVHNYGLAASQLARIRQRNIPLIVSIDLVAASGGYLMASVANKIIAAPFAVVGSIGVFAQLPNLFRFLKKHDIDVEQHMAGEYKATLTLLGENTKQGREKFRQELEETHALFKQFVKDYRPNLNIDKLATGEHWYGTQAIELKLIDEIMTSDDYLLAKYEKSDIFEVNYIIHQTLTDKISTLFHGVTSRLLRSFLKEPLP